MYCCYDHYFPGDTKTNWPWRDPRFLWLQPCHLDPAQCTKLLLLFPQSYSCVFLFLMSRTNVKTNKTSYLRAKATKFSGRESRNRVRPQLGTFSLGMWTPTANFFKNTVHQHSTLLSLQTEPTARAMKIMPKLLFTAQQFDIKPNINLHNLNGTSTWLYNSQHEFHSCRSSL